MVNLRARRFGALVLASALVLGAVGCSSDGSDGSSGPEAPSTTGGDSTTTAGDATSTTIPADPTASTLPGETQLEVATEAYATQLEVGLSSGTAASGDFVVNADQAACIAPRWITLVGPDTLAEAQVAPAALADPGYQFDGLGIDQATASAMVDAYAACGADVYRVVALAVAGTRSTAGQDCMVDALDHDAARQALVAALADTTAARNLFNAMVTELSAACSAVG